MCKSSKFELENKFLDKKPRIEFQLAQLLKMQ